ncbi:DUF637 domain-containing protein [Nitrincola sp. MINF-07-Sa-05]|uniref:DUF637 domain-containing protein n=1 Tax=Nitrincola salilacus TaxID=3400273 RepID=UPI0039182499
MLGNITLQANVNGDEDPEQGIVSITGSQIQSEQGKAIINGKHVLIQAATDTDVTDISGSSDSLTFGFGIGGGEHESVAVSERYTLQSSQIEGAKGVDITTPGIVSIYASTVSAGNTGDVNLKGAKVDLRGGLNHESDTLEEHGKKLGWNIQDLFGVFKPGHGLGHESELEEVEQQTDAVATVLEGKNVNITSTSGDITLAGVDVQTEGGKLTLKTANDLNLHTLTTTDYASSHSEVSDLAWQRVEGSGHKDEAVHYNRLNYAELEVSVGDRINVGMSVKDSAEVLMQEPGMEWVGALINDPELSGKIDWKTVQEAHDSWDYKQQGLTEVGAAVVVIVVAFLTAGAASSAASSLTGAGGSTATFTSTVMSSAIEAGITSIASTSAVTFINSGGDLGETLDALGSSENLQQILQSMITAGVMQGLGQSITIDGKPLGSIKPSDGFIAHVGNELITNITSAVIDSAMTGASLEDSIKDAVIASIINASAGQGADWIGDMSTAGLDGTPAALNDFAQSFSHAILGCMAGSASAGSSDGCAPGAVGGVVGELSAAFYNPDGTKNTNRTIEFSRMMASIAGAFTGQGTEGVSIAGMTGGNAAANNRMLHTLEMQRMRENAAVYAQQQGYCEQGSCTNAEIAQTVDELKLENLRRVDSRFSGSITENEAAGEFLDSLGAGSQIDGTDQLMFAQDGYYDSFHTNMRYLGEADLLNLLIFSDGVSDSAREWAAWAVIQAGGSGFAPEQLAGLLADPEQEDLFLSRLPLTGMEIGDALAASTQLAQAIQTGDTEGLRNSINALQDRIDNVPSAVREAVGYVKIDQID